MKKAASIFLRADITLRDVDRMIRWMENPNITKYMNEDPGIVHFLRRLSLSVPEPMLSFHFNRSGHFFLACPEAGDSVGFVRLTPMAGDNTYEIVYAIGEEALWGRGLGEGAIQAALAKAFFELRAERLVAKIVPDNRRSIRSVCGCGFSYCGMDGSLQRYSITAEAYLRQLSLQAQKRA